MRRIIADINRSKRSEIGATRSRGRRPSTGSLVFSCSLLLLVLTACSDPARILPDLLTADGRGLMPVERIYSGSVMTPARITRGSGNTLWVTDDVAGTVVEMKAVGGRITRGRIWNTGGRPLGIAHAFGRLYVGNAMTRCVEVFHTNGMPAGYLGGGPGSLQNPTDLALDERAGLVFVLDSGAPEVLVYGLDGEERYRFNGAEQQLYHPSGIALDLQRREVLVSDYGDLAGGSEGASVKIFAYSGKPLERLSGTSSGGMGMSFSTPEGSFGRPAGLCVDGMGNILVVDCWEGKVLVFDRETLAYRTSLGEKGEAPGQLLLPIDVVYGPGEMVHVTNNRQGKVESLPWTGGTP